MWNKYEQMKKRRLLAYIDFTLNHNSASEYKSQDDVMSSLLEELGLEVGKSETEI